MRQIDHNKTPIFDAIKNYIDMDTVPFHVPGHKHGKGLEEFREYVGEAVLKMDVNSMEDLDNACNPIGVIRESEELVADAFASESAHILVNGTTGGVQTMILSSCDPGDEIIIPRNAHRSSTSGIILSGAIPVYIQPEVNDELGIAMGITPEAVKNAVKEHPYAKAVFVINPTYYGVASDLKTIVRTAHRAGMAALVDEAHGAHMGFHDDFPLTAMEVGADLSAASTHKTGGSMTQTSVLLQRGKIIDDDKVRKCLNLTLTTSASYVLMSSVDVARKQLAIKGEELLENTLSLARYARNEINNIDGIYSFGRELIGTPGCFDFDETKLAVNVRGLGLTGFEVERIIRRDYNIQLEMADFHNILAIISIGDTKSDVQKLIDALKDIALKNGVKKVKSKQISLLNPELIVSPRDAYYSTQKSVPIEQAAGEISAEMIMVYPPGIPLICPGERITKDLIDHVKMLKEEECHLQGTVDPYVDSIRVLGR